MNVVFSPQCLEFRSPGHPESPERVRKTYELLVQKSYTFVEPTPCTEQDLLLVHSPELVTSVRNNDFYNWDSPNLPHIYEYATLSAGGAVTAMELSLSEGRSFSLMRPPGHHVTRENLGGFCYFNNIAIAVAKALSTLERVAILDFDCHHGNGTEAIFLGTPAVLYISWHQIHIYPGTGHQSRLNCINYPLNAGADHTDFMVVLEKGLEKTRDFNPDLIAVSAGFDGYIGDPLSMLRFQQKTYQEIGEKIKSFELPSFAVLEGGYGGELPLCIHKFLEGYF
jgi:acetoin utilization deacetylase AcuC-like enzyme